MLFGFFQGKVSGCGGISETVSSVWNSGVDLGGGEGDIGWRSCSMVHVLMVGGGVKKDLIFGFMQQQTKSTCLNRECQFHVQRCLDRGIAIILQRLRCFNDGPTPSLLWVAQVPAICFAKPSMAFCILSFCLSFSASRAEAFFSMSNLMAPVVLRSVHCYL